MNYYIAVFSIRTDTIWFNRYLNKNGISSSIVETPKMATASCGISVKIPSNYLEKGKILLNKSGIRSFIGFYSVNSFYGRVMPIR